MLSQSLQVVPLSQAQAVKVKGRGTRASHARQVGVGQGVPCSPLEIEGPRVQEGKLTNLDTLLSEGEIFRF